MNEHTQVSDLLPLYVSGALERERALAVEKHLGGCAECRADLALWRAAASEILAGGQAIASPGRLAERALEQIHRSPASRASSAGAPAKLRRAGQLLRSQAPLVQREIWSASAAVIGLGTVAALIAAHSGFIYVLAPLMAAACVAMIYGPDNDPAYELALSTPASPRQILLARLALVFGYNLVLVLAATLALLPVLPEPLLGSLVLAWLAPMTFLSAAALVLSLWTGALNAISITYIAWLSHLVVFPLRSPQAGPKLPAVILEVMAGYQNFWQTPPVLLALAALLFGLAFWLAGRQKHGRLTPA